MNHPYNADAPLGSLHPPFTFGKRSGDWPHGGKDQAESVCYLIGTDEAGYGPNFGPLVVSATLWRFWFAHDTAAASPSSSATPLFDLLDAETNTEPDDFADDETPLLDALNRRLEPLCALTGIFPVVDSKKLYHAGQLYRLERSLRIALALIGKTPTTFRELLADLTSEKSEPPCWERGVDFPIPLAAHPSRQPEPFAETLERVRAEFAHGGIELTALASRRIHPAEFNALLEKGQLKSDLLADATMTLATDFLDDLTAGAANAEPPFVILLCDKLGGRNRYGDLLRAHFPNQPIRVFAESPGLSRYKIGKNITVRFQAKGERNRPTAAASLASKYLRELSMKPFNDFWSEKIPGLAPTAGYPEDARRFLADIQPALADSRLCMSELWRNK